MRTIFIHLCFVLSYSATSQTLCALVSYPEYSNGYTTPHAYIDENLKILYKENPSPSISEKIMAYKDGLGRIRRNRKFGFINHKGEIVIPVTFDKAEDFYEGLAAVEINGLWGYINPKGEIAIEAKFEIVHKFSCGLAVFRKDGKHGYIDKKGVVVIPPVYQRVHHFENDRAWVFSHGKWGCIDKTGKLTIPPQYKDTYDFNEGFCWVNKNLEWGLIDSLNNIIIPFSNITHLKYSFTSLNKNFSNVNQGLITSKENKKIGYCNVPFLKQAISPIFDKAFPFQDSLAVIYQDGKCGVIDINGKFFIEPKYEEIRYIGSKNIFAVRTNSNNWGLLYKDTGKVTPPEFNNVFNFETIR